MIHQHTQVRDCCKLSLALCSADDLATIRQLEQNDKANAARLEHEIADIRVQTEAERRHEQAKVLELQTRLQEQTRQLQEAETAAHASDKAIVSFQGQNRSQAAQFQLLQE